MAKQKTHPLKRTVHPTISWIVLLVMILIACSAVIVFHNYNKTDNINYIKQISPKTNRNPIVTSSVGNYPDYHVTIIPTQQTINDEWISYTNPNKEYTFLYPSYFSLSSSDYIYSRSQLPSDTLIYRIISLTNSKPSQHPETMQIEYRLFNHPANLKDFIRTDDCGDWQNQDSQTLNINNQEFQIYPNSGCGLTGAENVYVIKGNKGFRVAFYDPTLDNKEFVKKFLSNFSIIQ